MTSSHDPAVHSLRLRAALKAARQAADLTQKEAAAALSWSTSKMLRIESGEVHISKSDLIALLGVYQVSDQLKIDSLVAMALEARKRPPWNKYRDVLSAEFIAYLGVEGSAHTVRQYETLLIPGILQTADYARATFHALKPSNVDAPTKLERRIEARLLRQELLRREHRPRMHFILDEAAVSRRIGPGDTMVRQLEHLVELSKMEGIVIQILPFSMGAHPGLRGPFALLEFKNGLNTVLYTENAGGDSISTADGDRIMGATSTFIELEDIATPKTKFADVIRPVIARLGSEQPNRGDIPFRKVID